MHNLEELTYKQLQALAKEAGLKSNQKRAKLMAALAEAAAPAEPAVGANGGAAEEAAAAPAEDLSALSRRELQARAKAAGIPANKASAELVRLLSASDAEPEAAEEDEEMPQAAAEEEEDEEPQEQPKPRRRTRSMEKAEKEEDEEEPQEQPKPRRRTRSMEKQTDDAPPSVSAASRKRMVAAQRRAAAAKKRETARKAKAQKRLSTTDKLAAAKQRRAEATAAKQARRAAKSPTPRKQAPDFEAMHQRQFSRGKTIAQSAEKRPVTRPAANVPRVAMLTPGGAAPSAAAAEAPVSGYKVPTPFVVKRSDKPLTKIQPFNLSYQISKQNRVLQAVEYQRGKPIKPLSRKPSAGGSGGFSLGAKAPAAAPAPGRDTVRAKDAKRRAESKKAAADARGKARRKAAQQSRRGRPKPMRV